MSSCVQARTGLGTIFSLSILRKHCAASMLQLCFFLPDTDRISCESFHTDRQIPVRIDECDECENLYIFLAQHTQLQVFFFTVFIAAEDIQRRGEDTNNVRREKIWRKRFPDYTSIINFVPRRFWEALLLMLFDTSRTIEQELDLYSGIHCMYVHVCVCVLGKVHATYRSPGTGLVLSVSYDSAQCKGTVGYAFRYFPALNSDVVTGNFFPVTYKKKLPNTILWITVNFNAWNLGHNSCSRWFIKINGWSEADRVLSTPPARRGHMLSLVAPINHMFCPTSSTVLLFFSLVSLFSFFCIWWGSVNKYKKSKTYLVYCCLLLTFYSQLMSCMCYQWKLFFSFLLIQLTCRTLNLWQACVVGKRGKLWLVYPILKPSPSNTPAEQTWLQDRDVVLGQHSRSEMWSLVNTHSHDDGISTTL